MPILQILGQIHLKSKNEKQVELAVADDSTFLHSFSADLYLTIHAKSHKRTLFPNAIGFLKPFLHVRISLNVSQVSKRAKAQPDDFLSL